MAGGVIRKERKALLRPIRKNWNKLSSPIGGGGGGGGGGPRGGFFDNELQKSALRRGLRHRRRVWSPRSFKTSLPVNIQPSQLGRRDETPAKGTARDGITKEKAFRAAPGLRVTWARHTQQDRQAQHK